KPHVADFGLAAAVADLREEQIPGGTLSYAAPEQVRGFQGRRSQVDTRSDVWSLGVILYELLTGKQPFVGSSKEEIMEAIERYEQAAPKDLNTKVPAALDEITRKCLKKEPDERFQSAEEMASALKRWIDGQSIQPIFMVRARNSYFTGRDNELQKLNDVLR